MFDYDDDFLESLTNAMNDSEADAADRYGEPADTGNSKTVPCPNCKTDLGRMIVKNKASVNVGRPYITCEQCSAQGKISFWFLDFGLCECGCPMYEAKAKKGRNAGRVFEACSANCPGKFHWL